MTTQIFRPKRKSATKLNTSVCRKVLHFYCALHCIVLYAANDVSSNSNNDGFKHKKKKTREKSATQQESLMQEFHTLSNANSAKKKIKKNVKKSHKM